MAYVHPPAGAPDWDGNVPIGADGQPVIDAALDQRFAHLDAMNPDLSLVLRQMMALIQRQNQQLTRLQTEVNEQFAQIRGRFDLQLQHQQHQHQHQQHAGHHATGFDGQNSAGTDAQHGGNKRPASPSNQSFPFPAAKNARTHRSPAHNSGSYFDPSQQQFPPDYGLPYSMTGQRVSDLDASNSSAFLDDHADNSTDSKSAPAAKNVPARPRDRPPPEYYTSDDTFMDRGIRTLPDLWKEYSVGWNNKPSLKTMNQIYGTRWHYQPKEALYWGIRRHIYELIEELRDNKYNGDVDAAIKELEARMVKENLTSIHKLGQALRMEKGEIIRRPGKSTLGINERNGPAGSVEGSSKKGSTDHKADTTAAAAATDSTRHADDGTTGLQVTNNDGEDEGEEEEEVEEDESRIDTALRSGGASSAAASAAAAAAAAAAADPSTLDSSAL